MINTKTSKTNWGTKNSPFFSFEIDLLTFVYNVE